MATASKPPKQRKREKERKKRERLRASRAFLYRARPCTRRPYNIYRCSRCRRSSLEHRDAREPAAYLRLEHLGKSRRRVQACDSVFFDVCARGRARVAGCALRQLNLRARRHPQARQQQPLQPAPAIRRSAADDNARFLKLPSPVVAPVECDGNIPSNTDPTMVIR